MDDEKPFIPYGRQCIEADDIQAVAKSLESDWITQGPGVAAFEEAFAQHAGARFAVAVSSGTAGLHLACLAAGLGQGDRVVTSPMTFAASANCALYVGAVPAFADIDPKTVNLSPASLEAFLKTQGPFRAVIPVHYAGLPCDMPGIWDMAQDLGAVVIEDACHALGARYCEAEAGRWFDVGACSHSHMTVFSFHPVKHLTTGEGGMVTTNSERLYERLQLFRSHGITRDPKRFLNPAKREKIAGQGAPGYYEMQELGFNYRIPDFACALGLSQLKKLDRFVSARRAVAARYQTVFAGQDMVRTPGEGQGVRSSYHLYPVRISFERLGLDREDLMRTLAARGIGTQVHYIPVPAHPYYRRLGHDPADCPQALAYYGECLSLPMYATLEDSQVDRVAETLTHVLERGGEP